MKRIRKGLGSRSPWITCSTAVLFTAAALALTQQTPLRDGHPFLLFLAAVYLTTRLAGLAPGLVAGLLGVFATAYFFLPPFDSFIVENVADVVGLGVFALVALVLAWLTASRERAGDRVATQARRQSALAELQSDALASLDRTALLDRAAALLHPLFDVEYAGIFQALPDGASLILKAGSGWRSGMVGRVRIGIDTDSFVRGALNSREPLIFRDLRLERTFNVPRVFADHNVISGVTVVVPAVADQDHAQPFGVIGLYTTRRRNWANGDVEFLQTFAHTLANTLDHVRGDARVKAQREWFQVTLASIGDGVIATDPQGHVAFINPVAQSLTGWNETEAISRPLDQILTIAGEKTGQVMENPGIKALVTRSVVPAGGLDEEQGPAVLLTRTGDRTPVDGIAAPMFDAQGRSLGSVLIVRDISARRRNEQALLLGAERFRVALLNSPVVVFNQDADLRYTWIPNITRGFPPPSALGKTDAEWMPPAEAIRWTEIKRGVLESGLGTREELAATVHGERRTFDLTVEPLRDGGGSVAGVTCTCIDITERKREQATTARLAAIVESSEEAITGATLDGIILSWNPGAERLYGYAPDEIIGRPHSVLHPPGWRDEVREVAERLKQGEPMEHRQAVRIRKDGSPVDVSVTMSLVRDSMGRIIGISSIARDITERKRLEDVQRFRTAASDLLSSSLDYEGTLAAVAQIAVPRIADWCAIHLVADDGTIRQVALAHEDPAQVQRVRDRLSRYPPDPQASQGVPNVIRTGRPELVEQVTAERLAALASGPEHLQFLIDLGLQSLMIVPLTVRRQTFGALSFACTTSGRRLTPDDMALAQDLANRAALWGDNARLFRELQKANEELEQRVIRRTVELQGANQQLQAEIAERRRTTEQLHQLSAHLQSAREEERISVAREIHDELGQILTAVRMDLDILERDLSQPDRRDGEGDMLVDIRATMRLVDDSIQKMHEIIHELRPEILDHLGLGAAIEWQAQEFQTRSGIECRITSAAPSLPLERDRSTAVFRILQEALTNVARHAQAKRVDIQLRMQDREFVLEVRDDGRGIAGGELTRSKSFGILGMRERALVFGGHVDLFSEPGKGTAVVAHIPMEELHDSNLDRG